MKVKELIKILKMYDKNLDVEIEYAHHEDLENCYEEAYDITASDKTLYIRTKDASAYDEEE